MYSHASRSPWLHAPLKSFPEVNLNGVTGDFASATRLAAMYIGAYGMDGTLASFLAFSDGIMGVNPSSLPVWLSALKLFSSPVQSGETTFPAPA